MIEIKPGFTITLDFETMEILFQNQSREIVPVGGVRKWDLQALLQDSDNQSINIRFEKLVELLATMHELGYELYTDNPKFLQYTFCDIPISEDD